MLDADEERRQPRGHGQDIRLALAFGVWNLALSGFHLVSKVVLFGGFWGGGIKPPVDWRFSV